MISVKSSRRQPSLRTEIFLKNHANLQATSVSSPVPQRDAATTLKPSKQSRRATIAPIQHAERHASTRGPRVDKRVSVSRNREPSKTELLLMNYNQALDVTKNQIADYAHNTLMIIEDEHLARVVQISEDFAQQIELVAKVEYVLDTPVGNGFLASQGKQDQEDGGPGQDFILNDCMTEFSNEVHEVVQELELCWKEWAEAQVGILRLTAEMLGEQSIDVGQHNLSDELKKSISEAENEHKVNKDCYAEAEQSLEELKAELANLCDCTIKTAKVQQKTWRAERNKMLESIKEAMANFEKSK